MAVGDAGVLQLAMKTTGIQMKIHRIESAKEAEDAPGVLNLIDMENVRLDAFAWGRVSAMCGQAAYAYIEKSIAMANAGEADAVCTAPINKGGPPRGGRALYRPHGDFWRPHGDRGSIDHV